MSDVPHRKRRRTAVVNPRFQVGIAMAFCLVVLAFAGLFVGIIHVRAKAALLDASMRGHYLFRAPYDIVGGILAGGVLSLAGAVILVSGAVFAVVVRRIRRVMESVIRTFRASAEGDLSTPTDAPGVRGIAFLARRLDASRARTLSMLVGIRAEVEALRDPAMSEAESLERWMALKERMGRIAP